ncbi:LOW QUALITY PROTEIN: tRNA pseudouridine synthase-like 1 [Orycteropus afer afer]|uniref:tRNA pseudouridine synthase n=1 Tax=Orycteropus afer afer TaxID=1230840 RepID=A0A8B7ACD5_ORYAF|nr:LOW QUALITY PROTEIN: tRNA pseudouridine synthase-like 1 [Orycteropus afer afer]
MAATAGQLAGSGPRRAERHPWPVRPPPARPARTALGVRPPARNEAAAAPPRLSPLGSVAKFCLPRAPSAVTSGERRQTPPPARAASYPCQGASPPPLPVALSTADSDPDAQLGEVRRTQCKSGLGSCGARFRRAMGAVRARYLVFFQYLGTAFNGVMAVRGSQSAVGVQNFLEEAAERLNSMERIKFTISSRTDAGVHALSNSAHLDVQRRSGLPPFSPKVLTQALNTHLRHPAIRVVQAFRVPNDFHARHTATSRTYLYRLATGCRWPDQLSVFERNLCWALQADLDVAAMQEAAQHLLGTHDFSAFQSAGSPARSSVRTLRRATVSPGPASPFVNPQENRSLRFWNLEFESQSFLYRQVRRMTAVLVAVGLGVLTPTQVKVILESKDPLGRDQTRVAPAHGLFLMAVRYPGLGSLGER